jgi:4-hydroxybenzoate decarboxylase
MRDYLAKLMERGEMHVVDREIDPKFELAAVVSRSHKTSDRPILFRRVKGTAFPVVANLYGSHARLCEMIGAPPNGFNPAWKAIIESLGGGRGTYVNRVPVPDDLRRGRLGALPQITWREKDSGAYITAGVYLAKDPETGIPNLSFARCFMLGRDDQMRACIDPPHDLAKYQAKAEARNAPLDVAVLIGAPPPVFLAACASVPIDVDELEIAARINGGTLDMYRCRHVDLEVPAGTEIVIEARIRPNVRNVDGPFGEFMGYYCDVNTNAYEVEVLDVSFREGAIYHGLLTGSREDLTMLAATWGNRTYRALVGELPGILDVTINPMLYSTIVKIDKQYEGHPQHVMLKVFGANPYYNHMCIVVDDDVDIHDLNEVWWAFLTRGRLDARTLVLSDIVGADYANSKITGGRLGIDATMPLGERHRFERPVSPGEEDLDLNDYFV